MLRQTLPNSLFRTIHRAKRRIDVRKVLASTPAVLLALMSVLFLATLLNLMAVAK
jgi:hypothetical protein